MTAVRRDGIFKLDNASVLITVAAFVLLLACLPLALRVDEGIDQDRPMYADMARMAGLQDASLVATGTVVPVELSEGESVMVGEQEFVASDGVSLAVRSVEDGTAYCITASNDHGVEAQERCS
jgi:hypothetical protein